MYFSRHNIFSKLKDSDNYFIVNLLTGSADILAPEKAAEIKRGEYSDIEEYKNKGYLAEEDSEKKLFNSRYLDFIRNRENDEMQLFFVPWYECNFKCSYCYQSEYSNESVQLQKPVIDAFFAHISEAFRDKRKYITIFGGEPLLSGSIQKEMITYLISEAAKRNIDLAIVTNGYNITGYSEVLAKAPLREIQITLDGTREIHDKRRALKNGGGTFDKIAEGIDFCLSKKIPVNLRVVIDSENINNLVELSGFAARKGWTDSPFFKTQLGRNYELHSCGSHKPALFDRAKMYEELYELLKIHPDILKFHKPAFSVSKFLSENGELPSPLFDSCPGCKTEWAFDYTGSIYPCTATVGKTGEKIGSFYPKTSLDEGRIEAWQDRDVTSIEKCGDCPLQLACGGGCGSVARNNTGKLLSPDCRPVDKLLELGLSAYFGEKI
ncbi:MAG TPA: radical SAM/SPASM domain-containing protein [Elusimicrobia bacterium]|nr:MAG: hypothetical protein A2278_06400 [Elusimicrobia bacterium RIFOXYA12_FULL_49_49]OGS09711.1 MAG: hypothetical protein A2204_02055 [Elusimicrobia bacterium RIFOXYA1_FULL_47_7]OGS10360.1 MAG: hypothetical protein A2386_04525 [Elusimicrobia bacterium RIFOXYB1_FULL_48_9]OGS16305.1 MAG: hypothetical protein A2251_01715 [Elusimicrobia bacterium RIFOXYA2_FULL_47_53]OGS25849.1 MAG: hypothetical protein A2339_03605 [Elusimicrobia bacterium RIFOXYB12_FULL_50_12]OGS31460.1 MAG: hypothetical protein